MRAYVVWAFRSDLRGCLDATVASKPHFQDVPNNVKISKDPQTFSQNPYKSKKFKYSFPSCQPQLYEVRTLLFLLRFSFSFLAENRQFRPQCRGVEQSQPWHG